MSLCMDVGSSETKIHSLCSGRYYDLNNNVAFNVDESVNTHDVVSKKARIEDSLDLVITKMSGVDDGPIGEILNNRIICGNLVDTVLPYGQKITSRLGKHEQPEFYANIISSVVLEQLRNKSSNQNVKLSILLPPYEAFNKKDKAIEQLSGVYRVRHNLLDRDIVFELSKDKIQVYPECYTSFAHICFNSKGEKTRLGEEFSNKMVIGIDIGKSTTDISGIQDLKPRSFTFDTFRFGCNFMINTLTNLVSSEYDGYRPSYVDCEEAFRTGHLKDGDGFLDIKELVIRSRQVYADRLIDDFLNYLSTKDIHPKSIAALMFIGGGSIKTDAMPSAAHLMLSRFQKISKNTRGLFIDNPRKSNLDGLVKFVKNSAA